MCFFLALSVVLVGCKKEVGLEGLYPLKGKITLDGEPVEGASISLSPTFSGENARSAGAKSDAAGVFNIQTVMPNDGVYPGEYTISVRKMVATNTYTEEEMAAANATGESLKNDSNNVLPSMYANGKSSGLKVTVVAGKNEELIIDLKK